MCVSLKPAFEVSVVTSSKANVKGNIGLGFHNSLLPKMPSHGAESILCYLTSLEGHTSLLLVHGKASPPVAVSLRVPVIHTQTAGNQSHFFTVSHSWVDDLL